MIDARSSWKLRSLFRRVLWYNITHGMNSLSYRHASGMVTHSQRQTLVYLEQVYYKAARLSSLMPHQKQGYGTFGGAA
jgi:hypothetical protein